MSDLYNQAVNDRGAFERLLARLPGFRGYLDRGARREADRVLRDHLSDAVARQVRRLAEIERRLLERSTGMQYITRTQSAKSKLQLYEDRIKGAASGYSGFFDAVKIDAAELDFLYGFDELQIVHVDRLDAALDTLSAAADSGEGVDDAIRNLDTLAREANTAFMQRQEKLLNLQISNNASS